MARLNSIILILIAFLALCAGCNNSNIQAVNTESPENLAPLQLFSNAFNSGDTIPMIYTCDSSNISPQLYWNHPLDSTASFALIMDDPDAPMGTWVHWIVYNIPAKDTCLNMHIPRDSLLPNGAKQGYSSFQAIGYGGPCPPDGAHRYFFQLYALNEMLNVPSGLTKQQLLKAMQGHVLAEAYLMGKYMRRKHN